MDLSPILRMQQIAHCLVLTVLSGEVLVETEP